MRFETFACERQLLLMAAPCRACAGSARGLRRFGGFATFYGCRSHPSSRGGECAQTEQFVDHRYKQSAGIDSSVTRHQFELDQRVIILERASSWTRNNNLSRTLPPAL